MPLIKRAPNGSTATATPPAASATSKTETPQAENKAPNPEKYASHRVKTEMTKDDYWRRREERDVERDANMAWSGLAQAALTSVNIAQLNADNTEDGLVALVARVVDKLLKVRDSR